MSHFEHKIIQGAGSGKWLPFARTKVAALHARARALRVTALVQRFTVEGGDVEIAVRVSGDQRFIHIRRKECPGFLSGFIDRQHFLGTCTFTVPNPSPPPETIEVLRRFYPSPAQTDPPRAWRDEPGLTNSAPEIGGGCLGALDTRASNFSGEMRKVVQILQGMDIATGYQYIAATTHGVFKSANGQRWMIEISNQGVSAWVMGMCRNPILSRTGEVLLDYTPLHSPKPTTDLLVAAREAGTFIDLLDAEGVKEFYTKQMYFSTCGWAFDGEDGHEAANVCLGADTNALIGFCYKIEITETENRPTSATLSEVEHGYLAIGTDRCHMRYPAAIGDARLFSFDTGGYLPVNTNAPVYCYYDGPELVVFRVTFNHGTTTDTGSEEVECVGGCAASLVAPNESGAPYRTGGSVTSGEVPHFTSNAGQNPSIAVEQSYNASFATRYASAEPMGINGASGSCDFPFAEVYATARSGWTLTGGELVRNVLAVPAFDREAVYIGGKSDGTPIIRTNYAAVSALEGRRVILPASCALTQATFRASALEECQTGPGCVQVILGTSPTDPGSSELCDNGVRPFAYVAPCTGPQGFFPYANPFTNGTQDGGSCSGGTPQQSFTCTGFSDPNPGSVLPLSASATFIGSGGARVTLEPKVAENQLSPDFYVYSEFMTPLMAVRDAFDGKKYIISPDQGFQLGSNCLSNASDYPVAEAGAVMAFVGVP